MVSTDTYNIFKRGLWIRCIRTSELWVKICQHSGKKVATKWRLATGLYCHFPTFWNVNSGHEVTTNISMNKWYIPLQNLYSNFPHWVLVNDYFLTWKLCWIWISLINYWMWFSLFINCRFITKYDQCSAGGKNVK